MPDSASSRWTSCAGRARAACQRSSAKRAGERPVRACSSGSCAQPRPSGQPSRPRTDPTRPSPPRAGRQRSHQRGHRQHQLPPMFTLLGYHRSPGRRFDSLIVKGDMTQTPQLHRHAAGDGAAQQVSGTRPDRHVVPHTSAEQQSPMTAARIRRRPPWRRSQHGDDQRRASHGSHRRLPAPRLAPGRLVATGGASNNWPSPERRARAGGSLMAGDPHLT